MPPILALLLLPIVIVLLLALTVFFQVQRMAKPEKCLKQSDDIARTIVPKLNEETSSWVVSNGYEFCTAYRFIQIVFAVWRKPEGVTDLIIYVSPYKTAYEFITYLENDCDLTSTLNGDILFPAVEGNYREDVKVHSLSQLYDAHQKSLHALANMRGLRQRQKVCDFEEELFRSIRQQMAYVKSLSFYPFRGVYWFFVTRRKMKNKTIEDQIRSGSI